MCVCVCAYDTHACILAYMHRRHAYTHTRNIVSTYMRLNAKYFFINIYDLNLKHCGAAGV